MIGDNLKDAYKVRLNLRFVDPAYERGFKRHYVAKILVLNRIALSMGVVMYGAFFLLDSLLELPDLLMPACMRLILMPTILFFTFYMSFQRVYRSRFELFISIPLIVGSLGHCVMTVVNELPPGYFLFATILMLLYTHLFSGLRLRISMRVGAIIILSYEITCCFFTDMEFAAAALENFFLLSTAVIALVSNYIIERFNRADYVHYLEREIFLKRLNAAKEERELLLSNILPHPIAQELYATGHVEPHDLPDVTVMFIDIVDFTRMSGKVQAKELVTVLNDYFTMIDRIMDRFGIERLKTIGDAYLCAGGLSAHDQPHTVNCCLAALAIMESIAQQKPWFGETLQVRIGIHRGPVTAGVVGEKRFAYDMWGNTVNVASRIEKTSEPGCINISQKVYETVRHQFHCTTRGAIPIKGQDSQTMYFLEQSIALDRSS